MDGQPTAANGDCSSSSSLPAKTAPLQAQDIPQPERHGGYGHMVDEGDTSVDHKPEPTPVPAQQLSIFALVILIFYNVSGGPFGSEQAVRAAGPLYALIGFTVFPMLWSLPQALLTAELATAFPDDGGYVTWVTAAFGPFWGFLEGVMALICGATDNAVYPALFVAYLKFTLCDISPDMDTEEIECPALDGPIMGFLPSLHHIIVLLASIMLTYFNWRGLELVGKIAIGLTVFMLLPFGFLCALGIPSIKPSAWLNTRPLKAHKHRHGWAGRGRAAPKVGYDWMTYVNVLFWNLNYWDSASTLAGEVADPTRNFPRALRWAVVLVVATYMLPMAVCIAALPPGQPWDTGFFVQAGKELGGYWLQHWILAAAAVSCIGQFLSVQAGNTYLLLGMAELGHLPSCFAIRTSHGAPALGIVLSFIIVLLLSSTSVVELVAMLNGVYCVAQLLEFAAFLELRRRLPQLERPYRVPLGLAGCVAMLICPTGMCLLLLLMPYRDGDMKAAAFVALSFLLGLVLFALNDCWRRYRPGSFCREKPKRAEAVPVEVELASGEVSPVANGSSRGKKVRASPDEVTGLKHAGEFAACSEPDSPATGGASRRSRPQPEVLGQQACAEWET